MKNEKRKTTGSFWKIPLLLSVVCHVSSAAASATTIAGTIKDPAGMGITGTVELRLSAPGRVADPAALLLIQPRASCPVVDGQIQPPPGKGACEVRGNDTITDPADTFYCARIYGTNGQELMSGKKYTVSGATFDLGAVAPGASCK